jgi:hypothetical protein
MNLKVWGMAAVAAVLAVLSSAAEAHVNARRGGFAGTQ